MGTETTITKIYVLLDKNNVVRYVGKTIKSLEHRLRLHLCDAKRENNHRANWIRKCLSEGYAPTIQLIEEVGGDGCEKEMYWIKFFREEGLNLVNVTDGGDGIIGYRHSHESRAKMSLAQMGNKKWLGRHHSQEYKSRMSQLLKNRKFSPETRAKISMAKLGKKLPTETKSKMSLSAVRRWEKWHEARLAQIY